MPAKKTKKAARRKSRSNPTTARELKVWLAVFFLLVFLVGSMALLQQVRHVFTPPPPEAPTPARFQALTRDQARERIEQALATLVQGRISRSVVDDRVIYRIAADVPEPAALTAFARELAAAGGHWQVSPPQDGGLVMVLAHGWRFELHFTPAPAPLSPSQPIAQDTGARAAIIMDDLGNDLHSARQLLEIDLAVTMAVLPELPHSAQVARMGHRQGREIIVHIPMEPLGYPATNPGRNALLTGLPEDEIRRRLNGFWGQVPHAVGGNNHMGSRFTQDAQGMQIVLGEMARHRLFFIDSLTTGSSLGLATARRLGVPAAARDVFLDNEQDVAKIRRELQRLIRVAQKQGQAIGICHPYRETLEALRLEQESFARAGVAVVPVSRLVEGGGG